LPVVTPEVVVPSWLALVTVLALVALVVAVVRLRDALRQTREQAAESQALLEDAASDAEELREQLKQIQEQLEAQAAEQARLARAANLPVVVDDTEYVITELGRPRVAVPALPAPQFVDALIRESVIRTASLATGLRRALAPDVRNRIRFEMKREVKRSRKQRRTDTRLALREYRARQRDTVEAPS
jgi:Sec-independent protein translocase protein TatA